MYFSPMAAYTNVLIAEVTQKLPLDYSQFAKTLPKGCPKVALEVAPRLPSGQFKLYWTYLNCNHGVLIECAVYSIEGSNTVYTDLHGTRDILSIAEDLPQVLGAQNISQ
jgi:hypothetical protein